MKGKKEREGGVPYHIKNFREEKRPLWSISREGRVKKESRKNQPLGGLRETTEKQDLERVYHHGAEKGKGGMMFERTARFGPVLISKEGKVKIPSLLGDMQQSDAVIGWGER